jgi:hypothetical protein
MKTIFFLLINANKQLFNQTKKIKNFNMLENTRIEKWIPFLSSKARKKTSEDKTETKNHF